MGDWIAERLRGPLGTVGAVVPRGFAAYARVLHPVELDDSRIPLTWAQVCQVTCVERRATDSKCAEFCQWASYEQLSRETFALVSRTVDHGAEPTR
ncbi:hypothetical protein [Planotetraspora mira]|uniref:Uncharacterized protein n=1 Tax=Planotetraspora mira TaxID=58121 RepID=A0A8J3TTV7_9ACTN|nr:hypothetical protein [Planotetraspora mira]GII33023.1 hypothetical protein Pmi06nite_64650 [Planotetraspora mira]